MSFCGRGIVGKGRSGCLLFERMKALCSGYDFCHRLFRYRKVFNGESGEGFLLSCLYEERYPESNAEEVVFLTGVDKLAFQNACRFFCWIFRVNYSDSACIKRRRCVVDRVDMYL